MKRSLLLLPLLLAACNNPADTAATKKMPLPGTVVAEATMPVNDDPLNHFQFSIKVVADSFIDRGVYDVIADYGPNDAKGQFTMPKGGETLTPVIRKGTAPYTYIIGFMMPADTTFYDYFEVSSDKHTTKMDYLKSYTF